MAKSQEKKPGNTYVTQSFRHKDNFDIAYEVGQDISDEDDDRILDLIEKGLAETHVAPEKPKEPAK